MKAPDDTALKKQEQRSQQDQATALTTKVQQESNDLWRYFAKTGAFSGSAFSKPAILGK